MKPSDFQKQIEAMMMDFIDQEQQGMAEEFSKESFHDLQEALSSAEAIAFTVKMNKFYEEQGILDENGDPLTIQHPENLHAKVSWNADGTSGTIKLTEAEERWIRANQVYGDDILGSMGFNYIGGL